MLCRAFFNKLSGGGIAPPGPTSSPTTEEKNDVFAPNVGHFVALALEIKRFYSSL